MEPLSIRGPTPKPTLMDVWSRFETWRKGKEQGSRIPKCLWAAAVELCSKHRVVEVSRALGLNYYGLRRRLPKTAPSAEKKSIFEPKFVELSPELETQRLLCSVEIENAAGGRLKMIFSGRCRDFDPMELAKAFLGGGR